MPKPLFTPIERRIYFLLCRKAMSARQLMEHLWLHEQDRPAKGLKQHLCNLRRKLKPMEQTIGCTISSSFGESIYYWRRLSKDGILTYSPRDLGGDEMARITLEDLQAAGCSNDLIIKIIQESVARRREYDRQRNRKNKEKSRSSHRFSTLPGENRGQVTFATNGKKHDPFERKSGESLGTFAHRLADHAQHATESFRREIDLTAGD